MSVFSTTIGKVRIYAIVSDVDGRITDFAVFIDNSELQHSMYPSIKDCACGIRALYADESQISALKLEFPQTPKTVLNRERCTISQYEPLDLAQRLEMTSELFAQAKRFES